MRKLREDRKNNATSSNNGGNGGMGTMGTFVDDRGKRRTWGEEWKKIATSGKNGNICGWMWEMEELGKGGSGGIEGEI